MILTDTHSHLYLKEFKDDLDLVIRNAIEKDINYIFLPNIDSSSIDDLHHVCERYPENCYPMMGLHPTSVKSDYEKELSIIEEQFHGRKYCAVGEIGIDLYWDKTFRKEQEEVFMRQILTAKKLNLPVVIHSRNSTDIIINILSEMDIPGLVGVFHCFPGNIEQAERVIDMGFKLGIGGVVTFKNSGLHKVVEAIELKDILLETDSPFLAPVPYRGKRNESSYIRIIAEKIAEIKSSSLEEVAGITTLNALEMFKIRGNS